MNHAEKFLGRRDRMFAKELDDFARKLRYFLEGISWLLHNKTDPD